MYILALLELIFRRTQLLNSRVDAVRNKPVRPHSSTISPPRAAVMEGLIPAIWTEINRFLMATINGNGLLEVQIATLSQMFDISAVIVQQIYSVIRWHDQTRNIQIRHIINTG